MSYIINCTLSRTICFADGTIRTKEDNLCVLIDDKDKIAFNDGKRSSVWHREGNEEEKNCADIVTGDNVTKKN